MLFAGDFRRIRREMTLIRDITVLLVRHRADAGLSPLALQTLTGARPALAGDLGVDLRVSDRTVAQVILDILNPDLMLEQARGAGMAQAVEVPLLFVHAGSGAVVFHELVETPSRETLPAAGFT